MPPLKLSHAWNSIRPLLVDPQCSWKLASLLLAIELVLSALIVLRVSYTEIDYKAYMQEVEGFLQGTRDYTKLKGDTGPLVYPAGFVYIYSLFYLWFDAGRNVIMAQWTFAALYILQQAIVFALYISAKLPPFLLIPLVLSKRVHSISLLRLFNDPLAMLFLYASMLAIIHKRWAVGWILFSLGVSIKMNVLLFLPALCLTTKSTHTIGQSLALFTLFIITQTLLSIPFTSTYPVEYLSRAFEFSRAFMYKWTVNWRMIDEKVFSSIWFSRGLLASHLTMLLSFLIGRWEGYAIIMDAWRELISLVRRRDLVHKSKSFISTTTILDSPRDILDIFFTCNLIGILCARSLHYQFYSWLFVLVAIEVCWNVYPATPWSSWLLMACHVGIVVGLWVGFRKTKKIKTKASTTRSLRIKGSSERKLE